MADAGAPDAKRSRTRYGRPQSGYASQYGSEAAATPAAQQAPVSIKDGIFNKPALRKLVQRSGEPEEGHFQVGAFLLCPRLPLFPFTTLLGPCFFFSAAVVDIADAQRLGYKPKVDREALRAIAKGTEVGKRLKLVYCKRKI